MGNRVSGDSPLLFPLISDLEQSLQQMPALAGSGLLQPPVIESLSFPLFAAQAVQVDVLRLDRLHPVISGNKWFKLKYNLVQALRAGQHTLLSFGGAWSNHLHALAFAAQLTGLQSRGIVRGDELDADANPMLQDAQRWGMQLEFVSRSRYREMTRTAFDANDAGVRVIPEGGDNECGVLGCVSLLPPDTHDRYDQVWLPVGTGCTFAGVRLALPARVNVQGVSALAGDWPRQQMQQRLLQWLPQTASHWNILTEYHEGGYGRVSPRLLSFIAEFGDNTGLPLDPVYTGKAMFALCDQLRHDRIPAGSRVLFLHTGGLQGARGFQNVAG